MEVKGRPRCDEQKQTVALGLKLDLKPIVLWFGLSTGALVLSLSPVLQVKVHGGVQVNICDIQELCVEDAGATGRSHTERRG